MKRVLLLFCMTLTMSYATAQSVEVKKNSDRIAQLKAMELGDIEFSPKSYYATIHNKPDYDNLWLGDSYSVYDKHWSWSWGHWGIHYRFNASKSKAKNVQPMRVADQIYIKGQKSETQKTLDSLKQQFNYETGKAIDCSVDKTYSVFSSQFKKLDEEIQNNILAYYDLSDAMDNYKMVENCTNKLALYRERLSTIHRSYMESSLKREAYQDLIDKMQKLCTHTTAMKYFANVNL